MLVDRVWICPHGHRESEFWHATCLIGRRFADFVGLHTRRDLKIRARTDVDLEIISSPSRIRVICRGMRKHFGDDEFERARKLVPRWLKKQKLNVRRTAA